MLKSHGAGFLKKKSRYPEFCKKLSKMAKIFGFFKIFQKIYISFFCKWSQMLVKMVCYKFQLGPYLGKIWLLGNRPKTIKNLLKIGFSGYLLLII